MEGKGIIALIVGLVSLILYLLKRRDTPERKRDHILRGLEARIAKTRKTDDTGSPDDIARARADQHDRIMRETTNLHGGRKDREDK